MNCDICGKSIGMLDTSYSVNNMSVCMECHEYEEKITSSDNFKEEISQEALDSILLTTETYPKGLLIDKRVSIITAEVVLGMNIFRDLFTNVRDIFGGESGSTTKVLKDLKEKAFKRLKEQAYGLGGDAVIAINLDYSEFAGSGRSMLFLVATGTAVTLKETGINPNKTKGTDE